MVASQYLVLPGDLGKVVLHKALDVNAQCFAVGPGNFARYFQGHSVELNPNPHFVWVSFVTHDQAPPLLSARTFAKSEVGVQKGEHYWQTVT